MPLKYGVKFNFIVVFMIEMEYIQERYWLWDDILGYDFLLSSAVETLNGCICS